MQRLLSELKEGEILILRNKDKIFKLHSFNKNPIIDPRDFFGKDTNSAIFNGGAIKKDNKIFIFPRVHKNYIRKKFYDKNLKIERWGFENYISEIIKFESEDGINFKKTEVSIKGDGTDHRDFLYGIEDIRVHKYKDGYFLTGCGKIKPPFKGKNADRTAIYFSKDLNKIDYCGIIKEFDSRNTVLLFLDEKIYIFFRFHPNIYIYQIESIELLLSPSKFPKYWQKLYEEKEKHLLIKAGEKEHESEKVGAGPPPVITEKGILFLYHSVGKIGREITEIYGLEKEIERGYSVNAVLLDIENPSRVIARTEYPVYIPHKPWEFEGNEKYPVDVPYVIFPTGIIKENKKLLIYAGAGDKYTVLLSADLEKFLDFLLNKA